MADIKGKKYIIRKVEGLSKNTVEIEGTGSPVSVKALLPSPLEMGSDLGASLYILEKTSPTSEVGFELDSHLRISSGISAALSTNSFSLQVSPSVIIEVDLDTLEASFELTTDPYVLLSASSGAEAEFQLGTEFHIIAKVEDLGLSMGTAFEAMPSVLSKLEKELGPVQAEMVTNLKVIGSHQKELVSILELDTNLVVEMLTSSSLETGFDLEALLSLQKNTSSDLESSFELEYQSIVESVTSSTGLASFELEADPVVYSLLEKEFTSNYLLEANSYVQKNASSPLAASFNMEAASVVETDTQKELVSVLELDTNLIVESYTGSDLSSSFSVDTVSTVEMNTSSIMEAMIGLESLSYVQSRLVASLDPGMDLGASGTVLGTEPVGPEGTMVFTTDSDLNVN